MDDLIRKAEKGRESTPVLILGLNEEIDNKYLIVSVNGGEPTRVRIGNTPSGAPYFVHDNEAYMIVDCVLVKH